MKILSLLLALFVFQIKELKAQCLGISMDSVLYLCEDSQFPINIGASMVIDPIYGPYTYYWDCFYESFPGSQVTFDEFDFLDDPTAQFPNLLSSVGGDTLVFSLTAIGTDMIQCIAEISIITSCWSTILNGCDIANIGTGESTTLCSIYTPCLEPATYLWSPAGNLNDPTLANPVVSPDGDITYCVEITDAIGCQASSCMDIAIGIEEQNNRNEVVFFPNPGNSILSVRGGAALSSIVITDSAGKIILIEKPKAAQTSINIASLPDGLYFHTYTIENGGMSAKIFVKE
jgi:hypothetical protein